MDNEKELTYVVEAALLKTGLVTISSPDLGLDFYAHDKIDHTRFIGVEVKIFVNPILELKNKLYEVKNQLIEYRKHRDFPIYLFFILKSSEAGYFTIFNGNDFSEVFPLKIDVLTKKLSQTFNVPMPLEFPPYKFYQRSNESKFETWRISVDEKFTTLRLYNLMLSPINDYEKMEIEVQIDGMVPNIFPLISQFQNPKLPNYVFFINGTIAHFDIALPVGRKHITFTLRTRENVSDFEAVLACQYLTAGQSKHVEFMK